MFNFTTICESIRRHWIMIALIAALSLALGIASSYVENGEIKAAPTYTAEAVLYVSGYGFDTKAQTDDDDISYNYKMDEPLLMNDARRIVVSANVAGAIRDEFGQNLTVASPIRINEKTNKPIEDRFVTIKVTGEDQELVKRATDKAAALTIKQAKELLPLADIVLAEPAKITTSDNAKAANWGTDALVADPSEAKAEVSISTKSVVIYLFVGLALSIGGFACYDILSRRIRSARDIERLLDIPVLADFSKGQGRDELSSQVRVLLTKNALSKMVLAVLGSEEALKNVQDALDQICADSVVVFGRDMNASETIAQGDSCLLIVEEAGNTGNEIECAMKDLMVAETPVIGAVFVPKKRK